MNFKVGCLCVLNQQRAVMINNDSDPRTVNHIEGALDLVEALEALDEVIVNFILDYGSRSCLLEFKCLRVDQEIN